MANGYRDAARAQNIRNVGQPVRANPQDYQDQRQIERQVAMRRNRRQGEMDAGVPLDLVGTRQSFAGPGAEQATRSMTQSVPQQTLAAQVPDYAAGIGVQDDLDAQANRGVLGVNEGMTRNVLEGNPTQQLADARENRYRQTGGLSDREAQLQRSFDQAITDLSDNDMRPLTATPAPPVAQPAMNMQPAASSWDAITGPAQMDTLRSNLGNLGLTERQSLAAQRQITGGLGQPTDQAFGRSTNFAPAMQVQPAPPRPTPTKVQPAPTAASVGKSMGEAVQAPQKAEEAPRSQKQKEAAQTGFVDMQRPAKQRKGYGQGRA